MRLLVIPALLLAGCAAPATETVPITGRQRPPLRFSSAEMARLGAAAYADLLAREDVVTEGEQREQLVAVGKRLAAVTGAGDFEWEFTLFDKDISNAFCLPGGKVGVYTGIFDVSENLDGLAVVLAHEIAHATLQHSNEQLSTRPGPVRRLLALPVEGALEAWAALAPNTRKAAVDGLGLGRVFGRMHGYRYSQLHEREADRVGLVYMQRAGFAIEEAPRFWRRMAEELRGQVTDSLSSHPAPTDRSTELDALIAEMKAAQSPPKSVR